MHLKQCEVVSRIEYIQGDLQEILKSRKTIKKWAYIVHDKDDTAPHYHIYLNFGNSGIDTSDVAKWFGLQESQVSKLTGKRSADVLLYLTHANDSQKNKHQYDPTEVVANFDFQTEINNAKILGDFEKYSYAQQLSYVNSLPVSEKATAFSRLEKLWKLHCQWLSMQTERNIDVIFVCGKSGTGKTYYAKKLLNSLGYDFCISSSLNDPFQDYLGQKAIILDDLRESAFEFEDLLKILDNNTSSSSRSRFSNKVFNGKVIVITSTIPVKYWYYDKRSGTFDTMDQLYRRIGTYIIVEKNNIEVYSQGLDSYGKPKGVPVCYKNELQFEERSSEVKQDYTKVFDGFLSRSVKVEEVQEVLTEIDSVLDF